MIESINIHHPTVVTPFAPVSERFDYFEYGTISFNGRPAIPIPTKVLFLLQEEFRKMSENDSGNTVEIKND